MGKLTKQYILDCTQHVDSCSFNQVKNMEYTVGDDTRKYRVADFLYDLKHGHLEYACVSYKVKVPPQHTNPTTHAALMHQYDETLKSAMLLSSGNEPLSRADMLLREDKEEWLQSEQDELNGLCKLKCWERVPRASVMTKILNPSWVYKDKPPAPPLPGRKKARLCCKCYNEDVCYLETFVPMVRFETV